MKKIHLIAAARPNFMKIAPLYHALAKEPWAATSIVHTGQHYDLNMSDVFFQDLNLPSPHIHLNIGSGTHAEQTGRVMIAYEKVLLKQHPDLVIVVGDVNSTVACTLAAAKLGIQTAHLEAGLRSFDRTMPEEINRVLTDAIADFLWTPSPDADENLLKEGKDPAKITRVGNIMIDSLEMMRPRIKNEKTAETFQLQKHNYCLVTLHRPSNVDEPEILAAIMEQLEIIGARLPVLFPVHPRTHKCLLQLEQYDFLADTSKTSIWHPPHSNIIFTDPLAYVAFMNLVFNARMVITDSGGIQEETTYLGIPCITLRENTERPVTITHGTNSLCRPNLLTARFNEAIAKHTDSKTQIEMWDGQTAQRIVQHIQKTLKD